MTEFYQAKIQKQEGLINYNRNSNILNQNFL